MMKLWLREVKPMSRLCTKQMPSLDLTPQSVPCTCSALWHQLTWDDGFDLCTGIWNSVGFITSSLHTLIRGPAVRWPSASVPGKQEWRKMQLLPSRCLYFSSISVCHKWLGSWILEIVLAENSVLCILCLRLTEMMEFVVATVLLAIGSAASMPGFDHMVFWCVLTQQRDGSQVEWHWGYQ